MTTQPAPAFRPRPDQFAWNILMMILLGVSLVSTPVLAQDAADAGGQAAQAPVSQEDLQQMLGAQSVESLEEQLAPVDEISPINAHSIRLLWAFRMRNVPYMKELLNKAQTPEANIEQNLFFESQAQFDSFLLLLQSAVALEEDRPEQVRAMAGDIIWQYPGHATILSDMISEYKMNRQMKDVRVPMDMTLQTSQGEELTLAELAEGKKGVLLEFWATWASPALQLMPQLIHRAEVLEPQQLVVAGINPEGDARMAETVRKERSIRMPWLVEPEGAPLSVLLQVDNLPRDVLIDPRGKVLFNGHPDDPKLAEILGQMEISLEN